MAVKTITVTEEAYAALAGLKQEGESFSDVIRRIAKGSKSLLEFAGAWKDVPRDRMKRFMDFLEASDELSKSKIARELKRQAR